MNDEGKNVGDAGLVGPGEREKLAALLERRLVVIGDQALREKDPDEQLRQLREVSEAIMAWHEAARGRISPRLDHFLEGCSYQKALAWVKAGKG